MKERITIQDLQGLRVGQGFDVHPFIAGRPLMLGGVEVPYEQGLDGHSDADVLLHALTDALLGAAGQGDIGQWFPNTDERYRGADSAELLAEVWRSLQAEGWQILNCDMVVLAEAPKLSRHIPAMKERIAQLLGIQPDQLGIKATTTERLGFVGRGEGISASAVALLLRS